MGKVLGIPFHAVFEKNREYNNIFMNFRRWKYRNIYTRMMAASNREDHSLTIVGCSQPILTVVTQLATLLSGVRILERRC